MSRLSDLRARYDALVNKVKRWADMDTLTEEEDQSFRNAIEEARRVGVELSKLEARAREVDRIRSNTYREVKGMPTASNDPSVDAALRGLDHIEEHFQASDAQVRAERLVREDSAFARYVEVHSRDAYRTAFSKIMTMGDAQASVMMSDLERQAMSDSFYARAGLAEGANTTGGYAVPVALDPTLILSDQENLNPFLQLGRVVDVQTNVWHGVSSSGVTWSFDTEGSEVSDDTPGPLSQPSVTVSMARGWIPFSIEVQQDWQGFDNEMARLLSAGYDELLLSKFTSGSGSGEPRGLLTALDANTNVEVVSTTDGAFGVEDIYKTWESLPSKFRRRASWMMSTSIMDKVRQFGNTTAWHAQTVQLPAGAVDAIFDRPVYTNAYFPDFSSTTGAVNRLVVGDFSQFVIARRAGMSLELVPHLLSGNQRPLGQRGYFAWARVGANVVLDNAFRLEQNQ
jgi:HK97 family phage major capsid protein